MATLSSAFSGVGAPEAAFYNICQWFVYIIAASSIDEFSVAALWALDYNLDCQHELRNGLPIVQRLSSALRTLGWNTACSFTLARSPRLLVIALSASNISTFLFAHKCCILWLLCRLDTRRDACSATCCRLSRRQC